MFVSLIAYKTEYGSKNRRNIDYSHDCHCFANRLTVTTDHAIKTVHFQEAMHE